MADFTKQFPDKVCSISLLNVDGHFFARWIEAAVATRIDLLSLPASLHLSLSSSSSFSPFFLFLSIPLTHSSPPTLHREAMQQRSDP